ncbi:hypothetical protein JQC72_14195 [Polycladomyces sp. WAk]|uniref:Uncharacterized protein n=1 Tax=Polycladomyces zharkentensis TaxID=2807616 RepID=A0ABS2WMZ5_9BACL|nr:hypothetical protein [Polycladomyces sp. WAk]
MPEKRIGVPVVARLYQQQWLDRIIDGMAKQGTAKLYRKKRKWFIGLPITFEMWTEFQVDKRKDRGVSSQSGKEKGLLTKPEYGRSTGRQ